MDPHTGEMRQMELFVAALGASGYLYAEATETQTTANFCGSIRRIFEFLGGVPRLIVPDNLKAAILKFQKDDSPEMSESFQDLTEHYQVGMLPARPRKPRDRWADLLRSSSAANRANLMTSNQPRSQSPQWIVADLHYAKRSVEYLELYCQSCSRRI